VTPSRDSVRQPRASMPQGCDQSGTAWASSPISTSSTVLVTIDRLETSANSFPPRTGLGSGEYADTSTDQRSPSGVPGGTSIVTGSVIDDPGGKTKVRCPPAKSIVHPSGRCESTVR